MIGRVCLFVGWFVRSFVRTFITLVVISGKISPIFMRFGTDIKYPCQMSLVTFDRSRSTFKVIGFENGDRPTTTTTKRANTPKHTQTLNTGRLSTLNLSR